MTNHPGDPLFAQGSQWYLNNTGQTGGMPGVDLNVLPVWRDYTGEGVRVAIIDDGVDYRHPDLDDNYDTTVDVDSRSRRGDGAPVYTSSDPFSSDNHGTSVAGIIAAEANAQGSVGVAFDATISSIRLDFQQYSLTDSAFALRQMATFDVANNSWGYVFPFADNFLTPEFASARDALENAASTGRDGLGTVVVFSGGNSRLRGDNANYHNLTNSRYTIAVGALNDDGAYARYSSPGANLLVSAFGGDTTSDGILTTDRQGSAGYDRTGNYFSSFSGTSAAAPMVSGVVALMLEANPNLGYRDVQEILAYSARQVDMRNTSWQINGANNSNGGGLHTSPDYGFGLVDAQAAVRLAETWTAQQTFSTEKQVKGVQETDTEIRDNQTSTSQITLNQDLDIDQVEVKVNIDHGYIGDLDLVLVSPSGTESVLMSSSRAINRSDLRFTFSSTQFWGENAAGTWTLRVRDRLSGDEGVLKNWSLHAYGDAPDDDDTYIYTNEFAHLGKDNSRATLQDNAGNDTLNASAITSDSILNLKPGGTSQLAGRRLIFTPNTVIENAIAGDGDDAMTGNDGDNLLNGGRGKDTMDGGAGNDALLGGQGNDTLTGGDGSDRFTFSGLKLGVDAITDFTVGSDKLILSKAIFSALASGVGSGFQRSSDFTQVGNDSDVARSNALVVYSEATGTLFYNANGAAGGFGDGGQVASLTNTPILSSSDFVVTT